MGCKEYINRQNKISCFHRDYIVVALGGDAEKSNAMLDATKRNKKYALKNSPEVRGFLFILGD